MSPAQDEIPEALYGMPEIFLGASSASAANIKAKTPQIKINTSTKAETRPEAAAVHPATEFVRHVLLHSLANLVALVCNGMLAFLLPRWLSMERYGYYRLFILYGSFAGLLHFGLLDGALVRWAGRSRQRMNAELRRSLIFLLLQHAAFLIPALAVLIFFFRHQPWFALGLSIVAYALLWNAAVLGQFALQAKKSFDVLSAVTVINPAVLLAIVITLHYCGRLHLEVLLAAYLAAWLASGFATWLILLEKYPGHIKRSRERLRPRSEDKEDKNEKKEGIDDTQRLASQRRTALRLGGTKLFWATIPKNVSLRKIWQVGASNIAVGWSILVALVVTNLALSLDRIAVSLSFSIRDFAIYSLAANALAVVNTVNLSVSRVVFPYLSDGVGDQLRIRAYGWGEATLMALWALSLAGYFPLRFLIERLLPAYQPSLPVLRLLMLSTGLTAAIYILHANYFRSSLRLGALLAGASVGLAAAALFLAIARRGHRLVNMSWAMLGAVALWWTVDEFLLRRQIIRTPLAIARTLVFTLTCGSLFLLSAAVSYRWLGALVYCGLAALVTTAAYGPTLQSLPRWGRWSIDPPAALP